MTDIAAAYGDRFTWLLWLWLLFVVAGALARQVSGKPCNASLGFLAVVLAMLLFDSLQIFDPLTTAVAAPMTAWLDLARDYAPSILVASLHCAWFSWKFSGREQRASRVKAVASFVELDGLGRWVRRALYVQILVALMGTACQVMEYRLIVNYEQAVYQTQEQALVDEAANDLRMRRVGEAAAIVWLVSGVLMLCWIHRASFNASQLAARRLRFAPGAVISGFLLPPLFLWHPLRAMNELYAVSHAPAAPVPKKAAALVYGWFLLWLAVLVLACWCLKSMLGTDLQEQKISNLLVIAFNLAMSCLAVTSLALVDRIGAAQQARAFREVSVDSSPLRAG